MPQSIQDYIPEFYQLDPPQKDILFTFVMLWTLFESRLLNCGASADSIEKLVKAWKEKGVIDNIMPAGTLNYFQDRYADDGETNHQFEALNLRRNDKPELVKHVILGHSNCSMEKLLACLIIVLRFRNNFFHGIKWQYGFHDQDNNFINSIRLLGSCLDVGLP